MTGELLQFPSLLKLQQNKEPLDVERFLWAVLDSNRTEQFDVNLSDNSI